MAFSENFTGVQATPAADHLFQIRPPDEAHRQLLEEHASAYHHTVAPSISLSALSRLSLWFLWHELKFRMRMTGAS